MASCKFEGGKCKGGTEAKSRFRHDKQDTREATAKHSNEHIDKSKTHLNYSIKGLSYREICEAYDARIDELDRTTNRNTRKDRVTMQCIVVPVPKDLPRDKYPLFFERVAQIMCEQYGEENFLDGDVHYDEEHEYMESLTKEMETSRVHCHYNFVPEVEGQLNGKVFSSRANINKLNNSVHKMCQNEFGVKFMDGSKKKGKQSVEQLKNASAQTYQEKMDELQETIQNCGDALSQYKAEVELDYRQRNEDLEAEKIDLKVTRDLLQNEKKQLENDKAMVRMGKRQNEREREKLDAERRSLEADRREFDAEKQDFEARVMDEVARRENRRAKAQEFSSGVKQPSPSRKVPELGY